MNRLQLDLIHNIDKKENFVAVTARRAGKTVGLVIAALDYLELNTYAKVTYLCSNKGLKKHVMELICNYRADTTTFGSNNIVLGKGGIIEVLDCHISPTDNSRIGARKFGGHKIIFDDPDFFDLHLFEEWLRYSQQEGVSALLAGTPFRKAQDSRFYTLYNYGQDSIITNWVSKKYGVEYIYKPLPNLAEARVTLGEKAYLEYIGEFR